MANKKGVMVQSVARALEILKLFEMSGELSLSEISERMGLSNSTAYGLVNTLVTKDFLEQSDSTKRYKLGIKNYELGNCFEKRLDIRRVLRPYLKELIQEYHETIHIARHHNGEVVYIDKVGGSDFNIISSQIGHRAPMYCTGVGKVMLAYLPEEYLEEYVFSKEMRKYTENTILDKESLLLELEKIRSRGYGYDDEEIEVGLKCIAVPILGKGGKPIAGISLSAPTGRMTEDRLQDIAEKLLEISKHVSKQMGY